MSRCKDKGPLAIEIEYRIFLLLVFCVRLMSLRLAYALAGLAARLLFIIDFKHTNRCVQHITHSGMATALPEARRLALANIRHMLMVFVEIVKFDQFINASNYKSFISNGMEDEEGRRIIDGNSFQTILATAHLGNWELAGSGFCMMSGSSMTSIMRPLGNHKIGEYIYSRRSFFRHRTFSKDKGLRPILAAIKEGDTIAIVSDQHASASEGVETVFFGHPARTHATPALLHLKTGVPIWPVFLVRKDERFHFEIVGDSLIRYAPTGDKDADIKAICQLFTSSIERFVRKYPEQWIWAHRRWLDINRRNSPHSENQ